MRRGPVCIVPESSNTSFHPLETKPLRYRNRCSTGAMDQLGLRNSTICLDLQGPQEGSEGRVNISPNNSSLGIAALVPSSAIHAGGLTNIVTDPQQSTNRHIRATSPINASGSASISRMDTVQQGYTTEGISAEAAQLLLSGWSKGTNTAYQSAWKKWVSWCIPQKVDPLLCSVNPFLDFLVGLFSEGLQH